MGTSTFPTATFAITQPIDLGSIPDYDIDNPSNGAVTTQDHGLTEFLLVATRS